MKRRTNHVDSRVPGDTARRPVVRTTSTRVQARSATLRRVAVVTGTRAEYGLLQSTMRAIEAHARLQLQLVVTGMHLLKKFGRTIDVIRRDGWKIDATVSMQRGDDNALDQARGLARGIAGIARFFHAARTDVVVVLGDRVEAMAGALAAITTGRLLAHVHGGDLAPGDLDDSFRHAITKLAHLHLPATPSAAERIIRMGEDPRRVRCVGAPGLDRLRELLARAAGFSPRDPSAARRAPTSPLAKGGLRGVFNRPSTVDNRQSALILHHPCGRSAQHERRVMSNLLTAVAQGGLRATCIYPNSDRGHSGIIQAITEHARKHAENDGAFHVVRSLDRDAYLQALIDADVLVGNSSSGIIEAAAAGTPAVNVGRRQRGREVSGRYVFHAQENTASIGSAIRRALRAGPITPAAGPYGDGRAGRRIAEQLARVPPTPEYLRKLNAY